MGSSDEGVAYLVSKGADVGQLVSGNVTVLHISAEHGLTSAVLEIVKTETGRKCCSIQTNEGNYPIDLAAMAGHRHIADILLPHSIEKKSTLQSKGVEITVEDIMREGKMRMDEWTAGRKLESEQVKTCQFFSFLSHVSNYALYFSIFMLCCTMSISIFIALQCM